MLSTAVCKLDTQAVVLCPSLTNPSSGTVTLSTNGTQTIATYSCSSGYTLNDNADRTCNSDGTWSLQEPTCTCESPPNLLNGLVVDGGETASYKCNQGYSMNGAATRTCAADGTWWSGTAPTCSICHTLSAPSGGNVSLNTDGFNTQASFTCNNGYTLNGVSLITCRNDGSWDFDEPTCEQCPELSDPDSGTLTMTTTGFGTTATFTCLSGYYLKGEFSLSCGTDGTWIDAQPTCECNFPAQPSNGHVTLSSTGAVASYICDTGHTLNGHSTRTCQNDGTGWEGSEPVCTLCQSLSNPANGSFSLSTNGTQTTASYACAVGTSLDGESQVVCNADGSWKSTQPTCVQCQTLSDPDSGSVFYSTNGLITTAEYACVTGYAINSTNTLTCLSSGAWDLPAPFCVCQSPSLISNGLFNISTDLQTVAYTCNVGYVLVGSVTRSCQNDGTGWNGISPACVLCPSLTDPSSGAVMLSTSGTQTMATYTCSSGYTLNGNAERTCNSDGTWSLEEPTCTCESPPNPLNGNVTDDGETASYLCDQGYSMNGAGTRTCGSDGTWWSGAAPTCSACDTLSTPSGGTVSLSSDGLNTQASYTCNNGYTLNGVSLITCRSDGSWDFTEPTCERCPELADPGSGTLTMTTTGFVTTATFSCLSGYYLKGEFSLYCGTDGTWSDDAPTCECNFPAQPSNGQVSLSGTGTVASYICDTGFTLNGPSARTCQNDGTGWEGSEPVCTQCQSLSNPANGSFSLSTNGTQTTASYACAVGTSLGGNSQVVCNANGSWKSTQPTCVQCQTLSDPHSGSISYSTSGLTTRAEFSCVTGYAINSTNIVTCLSSGTWDIPSPFCVCQSPSLISNGQFNISADLRTVTYTCNTGYVLVGSVTRTCQNDGTGWDGISPVCDTGTPDTEADGTWNIPIAAMIVVILMFLIVVILFAGLLYAYCRLKKRKSKINSEFHETPEEPTDLCNQLNNPVGGSFSLTSDGLTTKANYSCVAGYTLVGSIERTCQEDKSWSPSSPSCAQCDALNVLSSGDIDISNDGYTSIALHTCVTGYTLVGLSERSCQSDGSWDGTAPQCDCDPPSAPFNGAVAADGKIANYTCNVNYTLLGLSVRTCQTDGTGWNDGDPQCNFCLSAITPTGGLFTLATTGTQTYALYYCEKGYTLNGAYKVYCQYTGYWDSIPTCTQCETLLIPDSGSVTTISTGRVTSAVYTCSSGYNLNGMNTRTCGSDGTWDLTAPTCTCQSPTTIQNGYMTDNGVTANYTCDVGYSFDGATSRTCATDGSGWSGTDPVCSPCETLMSPTGGTVSMTTDGLLTMATYSCDLGYTLTGLDNITCRSDGTWAFSQPECVMCPILTDPGSGSVTLATDTKTTSATFSCNSGYYVSGEQTITCQTNGAWNSVPPTCKCITPATPVDGSVSVSDTMVGPVATYLCELGYSINGPASRLCQNDGSGWEGTDPTCNICDSITTSTELTFIISTNGSTTSGQYACAVNYTLAGEDAQTCQSDGTWNYPMPSCVSCAGKNSPLSGDAIFTTDGLSTRATFSCVFGYDLSSPGITTCQTDGSWNLPDPLCVCQPPSAIINGGYNLLDSGMVANYSCDVYHELVGPQQRLCLTDGTGWNGTEPRCDLIVTTTTIKPKDETVLPIPAAAFIAIFVIFIIILIVSIVISVCWYYRYKKVSQRVGVTMDSSDSRTMSDPRFNFESPDIEDGTLLIRKESEPAKATFNVNSLKKKPSMRSIDTKKSEEELKSIKSNSETNGKILQNGGIEHVVNGTPPHVPLSSVRLPKLPPKAPRKSDAARQKRKRRRVERREETAAAVKEPKPRTSTPIEIVMNRTNTPDILASEQFEYIQPVYCREIETPAPSRPTTSTLTRENKEPTTESSV